MNKTLCQLALAALVSVTGAANAQTSSSCAVYAQAYQVNLPADAPGKDGPACTIDQITAWFSADLPAIAAAQPPAAIDDLYGVWLSDNVASQMLGALSNGQEVLRISAGSTDRLVSISQQYYKSNLPLPEGLDLRVTSGLGTLISYGELRVPADLATALRPIFDAEFQYTNEIFEYRRSEQLLLLARLNHFENSVRFEISGNRLVVRSQQPDPDNWPVATGMPQARLLDITNTYIRVDPRAVDQALLLTRFLEVSQVSCFASFVHQLGAGNGPLLDALAPYSLDETLEMMQQFYALKAVERALLAQRENQSEDQSEDQRQAAKNAGKQWWQDNNALQQLPIILQLSTLKANTLNLGCVW